MYEARFHGIAIQAVGLTFGTLVALLLAYRAGVIRATEKFKLGVIAATGGIALFYLVEFVLGFFGVHFAAINGSGAIGIGFSVLCRHRRRAEPGARLRLHRKRRARRSAQIHGVVRGLRPDGHADLAVSGDPALVVENQQPEINQKVFISTRAVNARNFALHSSRV